jgi:hypothetical protein
MTTTINAPSISSSAMLVELSISTWTARKLDRTATATVNKQNNADPDVARVNKNLLSGVDQLAAITKYASAVRNWMYAQTLPWSDLGARLVSTATFFDFKRELDAKQVEFYKMVDEFLDVYPTLISAQAFKLGAMFDRDEFPTVDDLRGKFRLHASFMPVPEVGDFRVDIGNEGMRLLQEQYEASYNARLNAAMSDVSKRLIEGLAHVSDRLTPDESGERKMFQRTMLEKLAETVSSVRALNITRNEALDKMAAMTEKAIENVDIDFLKENETARDKLREKVDSILGAFDF